MPSKFETDARAWATSHLVIAAIIAFVAGVLVGMVMG
jgi:hypothetical protein